MDFLDKLKEKPKPKIKKSVKVEVPSVSAVVVDKREENKDKQALSILD